MAETSQDKKNSFTMVFTTEEVKQAREKSRAKYDREVEKNKSNRANVAAWWHKEHRL